MEKNNIIRFVQSLILLPLTTMTSIGPVVNAPKTDIAPTGLFQKLNTEASNLLAFNQPEDEKLKTLKVQGDAIDAYFKKYDMPLEGTGLKMAEEADKNDLDWRLLAAISVRESTGGIHACQKADYSAFGWGSCKINFESYEQAIEVVSRNLGGNNPKTAHHYDGKTTYQILRKYNNVIAKYPEQVIKIMNAIGTEDLGQPKEEKPQAEV